VDLGFLRPLFDDIGDYVSVYLDTDRSHENALTAIELRWNAARQRLAEAGASPASLDAAAAVAGAPGGARGYAVFARAGAVTLPASWTRRRGGKSRGWRRCRTSCRCWPSAARRSRMSG